MYCTNCGKELPDNSKFCNHCGASQKTVADIQGIETQIEQSDISKRKAAKKKPGCFSAAILLFIMFVIFASFMASTEDSDNSGTQVESTTESSIDISSSELVKSYIDNEVKADSLYEDKTLIISGYVNRIAQTDDYDKDPVVYVGTGKDIENCLRCYVSTEQKEIVAELEVGDKITVTGRCAGLGSSYFNLKCVNIYDGVISE